MQTDHLRVHLSRTLLVLILFLYLIKQRWHQLFWLPYQTVESQILFLKMVRLSPSQTYTTDLLKYEYTALYLYQIRFILFSHTNISCLCFNLSTSLKYRSKVFTFPFSITLFSDFRSVSYKSQKEKKRLEQANTTTKSPHSIWHSVT